MVIPAVFVKAPNASTKIICTTTEIIMIVINIGFVVNPENAAFQSSPMDLKSKKEKETCQLEKKKKKTFKPMHSKNVPGIEFIEHLAKHKSIEHNGIMRVIGLYA